MARSAVALGHSFASFMRLCGSSNRVVRTPSGVLYWFLLSADNSDFYWQKSTNGGFTWSVPTLVKATTGSGLAVWADWWTEGDSGTVIHLFYMESAGSDVFYRALDTASDSLGTEITVFNGTSASTGTNTCISGTKTRAGRIVVSFDIDGGAETGTYKSDDFPVTAFSAIADQNEATSDYYQLFPGNEADAADFYSLYFDRSAGELSLKVYDDSGNTWSEVSVGTGITNVSTLTVAPQFAGAMQADGSLCVAWFTNQDNAAADLNFRRLQNASTFDTMVKIFDSADDQGGVAVSVDGNDDVYVMYLGKTDGSETAFTALAPYYRKSTDDGATWGAETALGSITRPLLYITSALEIDVDDPICVFGGTDINQLICWISLEVPEEGAGGGAARARAPAGLSPVG